MKTALKLFAVIFFILGVVRSSDAQEFTVSGKVRYADNNEVVTSGFVKLYNSYGELEFTTTINSEGDYILGPHRIINGTGGDVIGIPDDEWEDYVPTGYPDKVDPALFTHIELTSNLTEIDIYVQRKVTSLRPAVTVNVNGIVLSNNVPVKDAVIYAQLDGQYVGFGVTDSKGEYKIKNIPAGDYILVAHKIGSESEAKNVTLSENSLNNFSFSLKKGSSSTSNSTPYKFALIQNYPNPFNPSTNISYSIAKEGFVTLKIYNNAGQQVSELVNSYQGAGIYNVTFDAGSLSSGIYFYKLETNGFTAAKKMILVK